MVDRSDRHTRMSESIERLAELVPQDAAYLGALRKATEELKGLLDKQAEIESRILRVRQTMTTLMRLTGIEEHVGISNKGFTDAIRDALSIVAESTDPTATARGVKLFLETVGYDLSNYSNPIASVSGTLNRLVKAGEAERVQIKNSQGDKVWAYKWIAPKEGKK